VSLLCLQQLVMHTCIDAPKTARVGVFVFLQVDDCRGLLTAAKRVVLAVDTDGPGLALAAELSRRWVALRSPGFNQAAGVRGRADCASAGSGSLQP
jgi:hypothetical protein